MVMTELLRERAISFLVSHFNGVDTARAGELVTVAEAVAERYAPAAPDWAISESVMRYASYVADGGSGAVRSESETVETGPHTATRSRDLIADHSGGFRRSGAAAVLSPYRKRRGGVI